MTKKKICSTFLAGQIAFSAESCGVLASHVSGNGRVVTGRVVNLGRVVHGSVSGLGESVEGANSRTPVKASRIA